MITAQNESSEQTQDLTLDPFMWNMRLLQRKNLEETDRRKLRKKVTGNSTDCRYYASPSPG